MTRTTISSVAVDKNCSHCVLQEIYDFRSQRPDSILFHALPRVETKNRESKLLRQDCLKQKAECGDVFVCVIDSHIYLGISLSWYLIMFPEHMKQLVLLILEYKMFELR